MLKTIYFQTNLYENTANLNSVFLIKLSPHPLNSHLTYSSKAYRCPSIEAWCLAPDKSSALWCVSISRAFGSGGVILILITNLR